MSADPIRRKLCKTAGLTLAFLPLAAITRQAHAATNAALRAELKYQDTPKSGQSCLTCLEFLPGKTPSENGGCKLIPGDDQISPQGYCIRWNTM